MKKTILILELVLVASLNLLAQKQIDYARTIKTQFPDEEVVISKSNVVIEFEVKSKHGLTASKNIDLEFIALEKNTEFV
ncbi:MAG: hypothetical protein WC341_05880, partial [Bacteroidales bacterium]